jgi:hypothetical protein
MKPSRQSRFLFPSKLWVQGPKMNCWEKNITGFAASEPVICARLLIENISEQFMCGSAVGSCTLWTDCYNAWTQNIGSCVTVLHLDQHSLLSFQLAESSWAQGGAWKQLWFFLAQFRDLVGKKTYTLATNTKAFIWEKMVKCCRHVMRISFWRSAFLDNRL